MVSKGFYKLFHKSCFLSCEIKTFFSGLSKLSFPTYINDILIFLKTF